MSSVDDWRSPQVLVRESEDDSKVNDWRSSQVLVGESEDDSKGKRTWRSARHEAPSKISARLEELERSRAMETPVVKGFQAKPALQKTTTLSRFVEHSSPWASKLMNSFWFKLFVNAIIVFQSFLLMFDQGLRLEGAPEPWSLRLLEYTFFVVYVTEIACQFIVNGPAALKSSWVLFDTILVSLAGISLFVLPALTALWGDTLKGNLGPALVLRTARLARLVRAVRLVRAFRQLWMLVHAFLSSAKTMLWVVMMLAVILYIFSAIAIEIITLRYQEAGNVPDEIMVVVDAYFGNMSLTMLTLLQFVCMDSIGSIYRPLIMYDWILTFYFSAVVLVIGIVLMNIVTAIIVNSALQQSSEDRELKKLEEEAHKEKLMTKLKAMFTRLDADQSGMIDLQELTGITGDDEELLCEFADYADPVDIFNALDIDGGGTLEIDEFCEGLYQVSLSQTSIEMKRMAKQMERMSNMEGQLCQILTAIDTLTDLVTNIGEQRSGGAATATEATEPKVLQHKLDHPLVGEDTLPSAMTLPGTHTGIPQPPLPIMEAGFPHAAPEARMLASFGTESKVAEPPCKAPVLRNNVRCMVPEPIPVNEEEPRTKASSVFHPSEFSKDSKDPAHSSRRALMAERPRAHGFDDARLAKALQAQAPVAEGPPTHGPAMPSCNPTAQMLGLLGTRHRDDLRAQNQTI